MKEMKDRIRTQKERSLQGKYLRNNNRRPLGPRPPHWKTEGKIGNRAIQPTTESVRLEQGVDEIQHESNERKKENDGKDAGDEERDKTLGEIDLSSPFIDRHTRARMEETARGTPVKDRNIQDAGNGELRFILHSYPNLQGNSFNKDGLCCSMM